ncbi:hypothetical protein [Actinoplanes couchii]|uniref:Uncharacterized protein n=1 Tax=Actinoplanes couchii TaxID=403638 RepID=A0ABQ3XLP8_9ACTN|nr:hypothetical protein [Actinoplanes couchii]MDR6319346.1 hypothetical protein [Actinoplanes couchii]GID59444.1 hypothetical protein Aco03nite_078480 [Actinoplanes couchii]
MGSDAELYVFDYHRYRTEVVAALVDLLRTGEPGDYLTGFLRAAEPRFDQLRDRIVAGLGVQPADLARHCTYLGADLRYLHGEPRVDQRNTLTCVSASCPERDRCVLHRQRNAVEHLNVLYEALVWRRCLDRPRFVGRTFIPFTYDPLLDDLGVPAGDRLGRLLAALGTRGAVFGYTFGTTEGVHGWLTGDETAELASLLDALPLPRFAPTYEKMDELHTVSRQGGGPPWLGLSLAFVRTVATIAAAEGRAVLWGNDVGLDDWVGYLLD